MSWKPWTTKEMAVVAQIFASEKTVAEQAHMLPRRSISSITVKGQAMGIKKKRPPNLRERIDALMKDGKVRSAEQIAGEVNAFKSHVKDVFAVLVSQNKAHIDHYGMPYKRMFFKFGPGTNAPRPEAFSQKEYRLKRIARLKQTTDIDDIPDKDLDEAHRSDAPWWPKADPVVCNAMHAMVEVGRVSA